MGRWLLGLTLFFMLACGEQAFYSETHDIKTAKWATDEALVFQAEITDTAAVYELQLLVDHLKSYRYQNIYLRIKTIFPEQEAREEQLTIDIADDKGSWVGKCSSEQCTCKVFLLDNFKFPTVGSYGFEIRQFTRDENLAGINSMTLELFKKKMSAN